MTFPAGDITSIAAGTWGSGFWFGRDKTPNRGRKRWREHPAKEPHPSQNIKSSNQSGFMRTIPFSSSSNFGSLRLQSKFSLFKKLAKKHNKQDATGDIEKTVGRKRYISVKGGGRGGWEERRVAARGRHERESDRERARDHPSSLWTNEMDQPAAGRQ